MPAPDPPPAPDSARLALPGEAGAIAELQRRAWGQTLPPETAAYALAAMTAQDMAEAWEAAILRPPEARCRVLVALSNRRVVGFATTGPAGDDDAHPRDDGAVEELAVDPVAQGRGHGSRLLHACVDTLRTDGFRRATCWVWTGDDVRRGFLTGAGWGPDGASREIGADQGPRLRQVRLHTALSSAG